MRAWVYALIFSLALHQAAYWALQGKGVAAKERAVIQVKVVEVPPPPPSPPADLKPPEPKPQPKKKLVQRPVPQLKHIPPPSVPSTQPNDPYLPRAVGGSDGPGLAIGGSGTYGQEFQEDLRRDAVLDLSSIKKPTFTEEALDAGLGGTFVVAVFVDTNGRVTDAALDKPIGYGMDARVLASARLARFAPRSDDKGKPVAGWTEIRFTLKID